MKGKFRVFDLTDENWGGDYVKTLKSAKKLLIEFEENTTKFGYVFNTESGVIHIPNKYKKSYPSYKEHIDKSILKNCNIEIKKELFY